MCMLLASPEFCLVNVLMEKCVLGRGKRESKGRKSPFVYFVMHIFHVCFVTHIFHIERLELFLLLSMCPYWVAIRKAVQ